MVVSPVMPRLYNIIKASTNAERQHERGTTTRMQNISTNAYARERQRKRLSTRILRGNSPCCLRMLNQAQCRSSLIQREWWPLSIQAKGKRREYLRLCSLLQATRSCTALNCRLLARQYTRALSSCTTVNCSLLAPRIDRAPGFQRQVKHAGSRSGQRV